MENETEAKVEAEKEETSEKEEETTTEGQGKTEEKSEEIPKETPDQRAARLLRQTNQARKKAGLAPLKEESPAKETVESKATTGELTDTDLDYFDSKGIVEQEDLDDIQNVMQRTGLNKRQVLTDEWLKSKLKTNKDKREAEAALPNSRRASASAKPSVDTALAQYEKSGKLPEDFELRKQVLDLKMRREDTTVPPWRK